MDAVDGDQEEEAHLARIGHRQWTGHRVIAPHHVECRRIEGTGVGAEVEEVVVDEEVMGEGRDRIPGLEAGHRDAACHAPRTADRRLELHQGGEAEGVMAGGTVHHAGAVAAVEEVGVEEGEVPATVPMVAIVRGTVAGAGIVDEKENLTASLL
jgi:hypothetical protein